MARTDTTLDQAVDPLTVECDPEPHGCGQPTGHRCTSIGPESYGQPLRRAHWRRQVKAGAVLVPTRPEELAGAPRYRSDTVEGKRRALGGIPDYGGYADR